MLANGTILEYKKGSTATWTKLEGLKEIPDLGTDPEKVDNTLLDSKYKVYENGIGDLGDVVYKFAYKNDSATSPYRVMRKMQEAGEHASFRETMADGTVTTYGDCSVSVKRTGAGVNGVIEFDLTLTPQGEIETTDPGEASTQGEDTITDPVE